MKLWFLLVLPLLRASERSQASHPNDAAILGPSGAAPWRSSESLHQNYLRPIIVVVVRSSSNNINKLIIVEGSMQIFPTRRVKFKVPGL